MEIIDTSGFYKFDGEKWYYTPNAVYNLSYTLLRDNRNMYSYPVDGWVWYDEPPQEYLDWLDTQNQDNYI